MPARGAIEGLPALLTSAELTVVAAAVLGGTSPFGGSGDVTKSVLGALIF